MLEILADEELPEKALEYDIEHLRAALHALGDPCKTLLEMSFYQKLDQDTISVRMGYKGRDTVKSKKYKCLARLKKLLENLNDHDSNIP
jgi:RNA polymerase sigma-70 factor (ECF subfamily)